jgi:hypothetical protein
MTHHKYSPKINFKFNPQTARIFKQTAPKKVSRNSFNNKKTSYNSNKGFNLLNIIFTLAGIFSVVSFGLIFSPSFASAKVASAQIQSSKQVTITTNYNSQEYNPINKGKSFLQPVQVNEIEKK